ncbi:polysaccharide biosynthesis tyrosine autokinase [Microbacterium caowuchunii]|uniref:polysaccharide biosynthesis tyrosine autokinase n=1 Tax=Microbacterium caowuchunii TaxID=2614638 RepID=UPI001248FE61|nr:polysaccharide biosynthesis tyrosine autokinase [Microbacterium caowuchunii]QEW00847.1 polysaccharide biosynthesis tyrosine autokinase [Microbacterium caowuchunii]
MELSDYIRVLRKNWLVIVVVTLVGLGAAAAYSLTRTPLYEAESRVFVSTQTSGSVQELQQGSAFTQQRVTTYVNLVTTPIVINPVLDELDLDMTAGELAKQVSASAPLNTTLIGITVTDPDPVLAADIANALGASLTTAVEDIETPAGQELSPVKLTRVQDALPTNVPVSPNVPLNLALGTLVGLALGIGFAVLRTVLDTKVRSARDINNLTDRPILGAIPFDPKAQERPLILHADPHNPRSEAFRALRTNLQFIEMDGGHSFVVTSSIPSEGKSTTTVNLAIALADAGKRVALIDTDLRKPKVAEYLGIEGGAGLTDVLIGRAKVGDVMLPWGKRPLFVLPAGKVPPNPSELLGSKQMAQLLEAISRDFDVVLLDAPPLLPVTDAAVLARVTSGALVVVAAGRTTSGQFEGALTALETVDAKVAGIILAMVPTRGADAYGYGYGYGYGGYGAYTSVTAAPPKPAPTARKKRRGGDAHPQTSQDVPTAVP